MDKIYTAKEAADVLRVSRATVDRLLKRGKIRASKVGNRYRITETALMEFMQSTENGVGEDAEE